MTTARFTVHDVPYGNQELLAIRPGASDAGRPRQPSAPASHCRLRVWLMPGSFHRPWLRKEPSVASPRHENRAGSYEASWSPPPVRRVQGPLGPSIAQASSPGALSSLLGSVLLPLSAYLVPRGPNDTGKAIKWEDRSSPEYVDVVRSVGRFAVTRSRFGAAPWCPSRGEFQVAKPRQPKCMPAPAATVGITPHSRFGYRCFPSGFATSTWRDE